MMVLCSWWCVYGVCCAYGVLVIECVYIVRARGVPVVCSRGGFVHVLCSCLRSSRDHVHVVVCACACLCSHWLTFMNYFE